MSDKMTPIPFSKLLNWVLTEKEKLGTIFSIQRPYKADGRFNRDIFGRKLETPIGPAAGPNSQLAQNIVASYYAGARFFELKTVQNMDGEELSKCVSKPCITAADECYNCEWSTELEVPQARDEYIKAWMILNMMAKEFDLGDMDGFQFNMSVGYDLEGIKGPKVAPFIDAMKDASTTEIFAECKAALLDACKQGKFKKFTAADVEAISPNVCNSVTISTLHGCPPEQIEQIANHLIDEKGLNTFIKCNPTLLGYEFARKMMDDMGYDYVVFDDAHFVGNEERGLKGDLQWEDAIPMLTRLLEKCNSKGLQFGVKITNTFPVDVTRGELPSEEMYMSGKALFPLSMSLANKLAKEFKGKLQISYSGGADYFNIKEIENAGLWPITVSTTILKPGGYQRLVQLAELTQNTGAKVNSVDASATQKICDGLLTNEHYRKSVKPSEKKKIPAYSPLINCYTAPCNYGCPIHQDITSYMKNAAEGNFEAALEVIVDKNPLPFMTGTICAHNCMNQCTRNFYESPVNIRNMKLISAEKAFDSLFSKLKFKEGRNEKVAIIGGGPAGLAAAYFLAKEGIKSTIFEKSANLGGTVRNVIPDFRISKEAIEKDVKLCTSHNVEVKLNTKIDDVASLKSQGFSHVIWAVGATVPGELKIDSDKEPLNAVEFLSSLKSNPNPSLGKNVVVIGGGNTAMDTARAAKRTAGVEHSYIVYRRTKRYMPADEEELVMAIDDGVEFKELLAPISHKNGKLLCEVMRLGKPDASGRRGVEGTGEKVESLCDTVIASVGEKAAAVPAGVIAAGDAVKGPATIVEAIRDARAAVDQILAANSYKLIPSKSTESEIYAVRGKIALRKAEGSTEEQGRCLGCDVICENCVEVCPNRANVAIKVPGLDKKQVIHVDYMCNECGNCLTFCPYDSSPYLSKFTLFANEADFAASKNQGFTVLDKNNLQCKIRLDGKEFTWKKGDSISDENIASLIEAVVTSYDHLLI